MKRTTILAIAVGIAAGLSVGTFADMDSIDFQKAVTIAGVRASTNSFVLRGEVAGVAVVINDFADRTNTVAITSADGQTIFSKSCVSGTNFYPIAVPYQSTAGVVSSTDTNRPVCFQPVASLCKSIVTGADANGTNTIRVTVLIKK